MNFWINAAFSFLNLGLAIGLIIGALLLLRPLLVRILSPQKRVWLWLVVWLPAYIPSWYGVTSGLRRVMPVNFRSLVTPRTDTASFDIPAFLPNQYNGEGAYNLALPGGELLQVELQDEWMALLALIWLAGIVGMGLYSRRLDRRLMERARQGRVLQRDDPLLERIPAWAREETLVRICEGLPASFIRVGKEKVDGVTYRKAVYLQKELRPEQMELVMRHEGQHLELSHCGWKTYANIGLVLYWWNPLVWLGYRYFCRDLELACDRAVLNELDEGERREYARTLVELGSGRQLWEAPLSFGECDAALRVRAVVAWKPPTPKWGRKNLTAVTVTALLALFFLAGPEALVREEDRALAWQRQVEDATVVHFPASTIYRQADAQPLYLTELWIKAEDGDNPPAYYYGKDETGTWWTFSVDWHNSREEYQAYRQYEATGFPERLEQEAFLQIK